MSDLKEDAPVPIIVLLYDEHNLFPELLNKAQDEFVTAREVKGESLVIVVLGRVSHAQEG